MFPIASVPAVAACLMRRAQHKPTQNSYNGMFTMGIPYMFTDVPDALRFSI